MENKIVPWFTKDGTGFHEEKDARYHACTHRKCTSCDNLTEKYKLFCNKCELERKIEKFNSYESKEWDGITPLYDFLNDEYVFDLNYYLDDQAYHLKASDLCLVFCQRKHQKLVSIEDIIDLDGVKEEIEIDKEIVNAVEKLNEAIEKYEPSLWEPSKIRAIIKD